jgi:hypothetical protein
MSSAFEQQQMPTAESSQPSLLMQQVPGAMPQPGNRDRFRHRLQEISKAKVMIPAMVPQEKGEYMDFASPDRKFIRANGELLLKVGDNPPVSIVNENSISKIDPPCYGIGDEQCDKFMFECLLNDNPDASQRCIKSLSNLPGGFIEGAKEDIKRLHPILALRILQQFGFRKYQEYDHVAGMPLYKVECASSWVKNYLAKSVDHADIVKMLTDENSRLLIQYLNLIVQFVNANPAILNKNYTGSSNEAKGLFVPNQFLQSLGFDEKFTERTDKTTYIRDIGRLRSHLQYNAWWRPSQKMLGYPPFLGSGNYTPGYPMLQRGGGGATCAHVHALRNSGQSLGSDLIHALLNKVLTEFRARGKRLDSTDEQNIKGRIEKIKGLENQLIETLCYIDEYNGLMASFGDNTNQTVSEAELKKLLGRADVILGKQQSYYGNVLDYLAKIVDTFTTYDNVDAADI